MSEQFEKAFVLVQSHHFLKIVKLCHSNLNSPETAQQLGNFQSPNLQLNLLQLAAISVFWLNISVFGCFFVQLRPLIY